MSKAKLSASEWELVKDAPYWVNAALAAADGRVAFLTSRREAKALDQAISSYKSTNALVKDIVAEESDAAKEVKNATQSSAEKALSQIATVVEQKLGRDDLDALSDFLLEVGQTVAASAGEGVLGLGEHVSKKEAAALEGIAAALKATEADKQARRQAKQRQARAERESAAKAAADAKAEASAKEEARAKEEAEKSKAAAEIQAKMKAEQAQREAERKARQDALAKEKAEREAAARAAAEAKAAEEARAAAEAKAAEEARVAAEASAQAAAAQFIADHTVVSGDNLSMISQKYYGTQVNWRAIYEANKEIIGDNPSLIRPGQVLRIPKL